MGQPESLPKAMEVEADAVEPVPDIPEVIEEAIAVKPDAIAKPLELIPDNPEDWITTKALAALLTSQGIKASPRTLQEWGQKHQATKPGFKPPYIAKKADKGRYIWKPAVTAIGILP